MTTTHAELPKTQEIKSTSWIPHMNIRAFGHGGAPLSGDVRCDPKFGHYIVEVTSANRLWTIVVVTQSDPSQAEIKQYPDRTVVRLQPGESLIETELTNEHLHLSDTETGKSPELICLKIAGLDPDDEPRPIYLLVQRDTERGGPVRSPH